MIFPLHDVAAPVRGPGGVNPCSYVSVATYHSTAWVSQQGESWYQVSIRATVRTFDAPWCAPVVLDSWAGCSLPDPGITYLGCTDDETQGPLSDDWHVDGEYARCFSGLPCEYDNLSATLSVRWDGQAQCSASWSPNGGVPPQSNDPSTPRLYTACWQE